MIGALRFDPRLQINEDVLFNLQFLQNGSAIYCLHGVYYKQNDVGIGSLSRSLRGDLLDAEAITRPALEALLTQNGIVLPIFYETSYYVTAPSVTGLHFSPFGCHVYFSEGRKKG